MAAEEHPRATGASRRSPEELRRGAEDSPEGQPIVEPEPGDAGALIHELRVHQIELEMQNEELRCVHLELEQQREKYFALFDRAPVGYITVDENCHVIEANRTAADLLGVERDEIHERSFLEFVVPNDRDGFYLSLREQEKSGKPQTRELRLCYAADSRRGGGAGDEFWALLEVRPEVAPDGATQASLIAFTDIDESKREQAIMAARLSITEYARDHTLDETIQRALDEIEAVTNSRIGFFHFVDDDQTSLRRQTWSTATTATACLAEGKASHCAIPEAGVWADCVREGRPIVHNDYAALPLRRGMPPGHADLVRELTVPVYRGGGARAILGVGNKPSDYNQRDVDAVVRLADLTLDLVLAKNTEARENETWSLLQAVAEATTDAVFVKDLEGRYLLFNAGAESATGKKAEDVIGQDDTVLFPRDEALALMEADRAVMKGGETVTAVEYLTSGGRGVVIYSATKGPVRGPDGSVTGMFGISRDVTRQSTVGAYRGIEQEVLAILNATIDPLDSIEEVLAVVKAGTGFEVVGIRLQDGDDYPYLAQTGLSDEFVAHERSLIETDESGNAFRDRDGNAKLACACGIVLSGEADAQHSLLTAGGSFWTDDSLEVLDLEPHNDTRFHPRNRCMSEGFLSIALVPIRTAERTIGLLQLNDRSKGRLDIELVERLELIASHIGEALMRQESARSLHESEDGLLHALAEASEAFMSSIELLGQVVETRDPYTAGHERRVSELSVRIAQDMEMPASEIEEIRVAALIHDIGKISVPAEILSKPGALADMEFELIKAHAVAGYNILTAARFPATVAEIVYQHHERCDGSGYPRGLDGDHMLQSAKVIMVADVVEAMSSHRPYRAALGIDVAMAEIERGSGRQYDSEVSDACLRVVRGGFEFTDFKASEEGVRGTPPEGVARLRGVG